MWHGNPAMQLESLNFVSVIKFDRGRGGRQGLQRADKVARRGDRKMRCQRGAVGPLLEKHQPERILAVDMHRVRDASGLGARAMDMLKAQSPYLVKAVGAGGDAAGDDDHDLPLLFERDLFGKPLGTFPDHALRGGFRP